jgi:hypothetical protein
MGWNFSENFIPCNSTTVEQYCGRILLASANRYCARRVSLYRGRMAVLYYELLVFQFDVLELEVIDSYAADLDIETLGKSDLLDIKAAM